MISKQRGLMMSHLKRSPSIVLIFTPVSRTSLASLYTLNQTRPVGVTTPSNQQQIYHIPTYRPSCPHMAWYVVDVQSKFCQLSVVTFWLQLTSTGIADSLALTGTTSGRVDSGRKSKVTELRGWRSNGRGPLSVSFFFLSFPGFRISFLFLFCSLDGPALVWK